MALAFIVAWTSGRARGRALLSTSRRLVLLYGLAAVLIGMNWFLYVWAVNAGFVVETSLGYFMTPLVNVVLGVMVFRERLTSSQWAAVALAAAGVLYLTWAYRAAPWIALGLAGSFGSYGLVKKKGTLPAVEGLTLETAVLVLPAAAWLVSVHADGDGAFLRGGLVIPMLLAGSGVITIVPLLLFASSVRLVPLSIVGILQYIAPSIQLVLGILLYREPFTRTQLIGFGCVWAALVVFAVEGLRRRQGPLSA